MKRRTVSAHGEAGSLWGVSLERIRADKRDMFRYHSEKAYAKKSKK